MNVQIFQTNIIKIDELKKDIISSSYGIPGCKI
jgi:hypothetical protein